MANYTVHIEIGDGHADDIVTLDCADDAAALQAAGAFAGCHDVAVWSGCRKLGTIHHYITTTPADEAAKSSVTLLRPTKRGRGKWPS